MEEEEDAEDVAADVRSHLAATGLGLADAVVEAHVAFGRRWASFDASDPSERECLERVRGAVAGEWGAAAGAPLACFAAYARECAAWARASRAIASCVDELAETSATARCAGAARELRAAAAGAFVDGQRAVRLRYGWSAPPTRAALAEIAAHGPLLDAGAGAGHWAAELRRAHGSDVLAFDAEPRGPGVVVAGPEECARHPGRALLLSWPDYDGRGGFGAACVGAYAGAVVLLVGELAGDATPWLVAAGALPAHGQCASEELQAALAAGWSCARRVPLPCWPGCRDTLRVFVRRRRVDDDDGRPLAP